MLKTSNIFIFIYYSIVSIIRLYLHQYELYNYYANLTLSYHLTFFNWTWFYTKKFCVCTKYNELELTKIFTNRRRTRKIGGI